MYKFDGVAHVIVFCTQGWSVNTAVERMGKKLAKSTTLPSSATHPGAMTVAPDSASGGDSLSLSLSLCACSEASDALLV